MVKINDDFVRDFRKQLKEIARQLTKLRKSLKAHGLEIKVGDIGPRLLGPIPQEGWVCFASVGTVLKTEDFIEPLKHSLKLLKVMIRVIDMKPKIEKPRRDKH